MRNPSNGPKTLTDDEVRALLRATSRTENDLRDHVLLLLALTTGLRVSELVALNIGDLCGSKGMRTVVTLRSETTKGNRPGEIVIPERTRRKVVRYLAWKRKRLEPMNEGAPLFLSRGGGRARSMKGSRLSVRSAQQVFAIWQQRAGFDRRANFHVLRHTYASTLLRKTKNLRLVQVCCRHASPSTTAIYTHPSSDELITAAESLDW
jgi:site-specific recombinase XerD